MTQQSIWLIRLSDTALIGNSFKIKSGTYTGTGSGFLSFRAWLYSNFGFIKATDSTSDGGQIKWTGGLSSSQSF